MMGMNSCPDLLIVILGTCALLISFAGLRLLVLYWREVSRIRDRAILTFLLLLMLLVLMDANRVLHDRIEGTLSLIDIPMPLVVLVLLVSAGYCAAMLRRLIRWKHSHIPVSAIKAGLDHLSTGICCFTSDGVPRLVNREMERLSVIMLGEPVHDGNRLWKCLTEGRVAGGCTVRSIGEQPMILLPDGRTRRFTRREFVSGGDNCIEIDAFDVTEEYNSLQELEERNRELHRVNEQLLHYQESLTAVTRERETLETKIRIHAGMNRLLLGTLHSTETDADPLERERILEQWRGNILMLARESVEEQESLFSELHRAAESIGLRLTVRGQFSGDNSRRRVLLFAAGECMTNAVRHAGAGEMTLTLCGNTAEFTNNGAVPEEPVREGGGLGEIRRRMTELSGTVEVEIRPVFLLRLKFPADDRREEKPK